MKFRFITGALLALAAVSTQAASDAPTGYTKCAQNTGATCTMTGSRSVALGKSGSFVYATKTDSFACIGSAFPSNSYTTSAWCSYAGSTSAASSAAASSAAASAAASSKAASSAAASSKAASSVAASSKAASSTAGIPAATGTVINPTTVTIPANTTKDYGFQRIGISAQAASCDDEGQKPVFLLEDGAVLKNVIIHGGLNGSDGVHCKGNCTLENVHWEDVCEDAATMLGGSGKVMSVVGGSASHASDKVFQHNGKGSTVKVRDFNTYGDIGRFWMSCGNCSDNGGPRKLDIDRVNITGRIWDSAKNVQAYAIRLNYNYGDKATVRNLKIKNYVKGSPKVCVQAVGVQPGEAQTNNGEFFNTAYCDLSPADVTAY
ncbi:pectate lyase [Uliginosibacterium aquaticum]|uniref:Pectate lyase n=1 Tax=Uliginosibacterium aquaticum TaxID=2731212 RepID=A0ABX2IEP0_9RHOO|nr:pectate lyase [Uliginosibacterium aquaticum]NSL54268.1 pectate lyase [Uliginosibacterium aquaticum]